MQNNPTTGDEKETVRLSKAESRLSAQPDPTALLRVASEVPRPSWLEEPPTVFGPERAMAASVSGSEYWLG
jgi:hypothetical protein